MSPDSPLALYLCGLIGSLAVEISSALNESLALGGHCPPKYKRPFFVLIRFLFAAGVAGPLPIIASASTLWAAFYLGATAPLFLDKLARGAADHKPLPKDDEK